MTYIEEIIKLVDPVFKHWRYTYSNSNGNIYPAYEKAQMDVMNETYKLLTRKHFNMYYNITQEDLDNIRSYCDRFNYLADEVMKRC